MSRNSIIKVYINRIVKSAASVILICVILQSGLYASGYISIGTGGMLAGESSGEENQINYGIPVLIGFQYSPEYRDSWMFNSSFTYADFQGDNSPNEIFIGTAGVMFIKPFFYYNSNITNTVISKNSCIGTVLLPITVMRDSMNNIFQFLIPRHPFAFLDFAVIKEAESDMLYGFSGGAGLTSGGIDLILRYTQNIRYNEGFKRDIYVTSIGFTFNIPLQQKFLRTKPLIDE